MKASETTLRRLIEGQVQFVVPLYQRPYGWTTAQLDTLWSDIVAQADALQAGRGLTHFIGSVVLAPSPELTPGNLQWVVVDGQQRLTTLILALCAIRDHLAAEDPAHRERLNELHLINKFAHGDMRYRLLPTQVDREAFKACVDGVANDAPSGVVTSSYWFFRSRLIEADDPTDLHDVARIESAVLDRLSLVQITVEADDNAFRIFESINNTGMRLSQVDLIRNYVFMCLPTRMSDVYEQHWLPMQRRLGRLPQGTKALDQLMYLSLVLRRGDEAKHTDTYRGHQELISEIQGDEDKIEQYVADLAHRARHLEMILDPARAPEGIRERLLFLNEWEATTAFPVVMKLLELREDGDANADDEQVESALGYIESFFVRRLIGGIASRSLSRIFQRLTLQIDCDEPVAEAVRRALSAERLYWPTDEQFRDYVRTSKFYWLGRGPQRKLVLRKLAETYRSAEHVDLADSGITIEHVLPQNLTTSWREQLATDGEDPRELHSQLVHSLGNLTLTGYNSELGDMPYDEKRKLLTQTSIAMNHPITAQERWGKGEILSRADDLAERATKLWPGPLDVGQSTGPGRDWTLLHSALAVLPTGSWTTYGDLAGLIGSAPRPVGAHLASTPVPNAYRVLTVDGRLSAGFRWVDENDTRDVRQVLIEEGLRFDGNGCADPAQKMSTRDLALRLDLPGADELADELAEGVADDVDPATLTEWEHRFYSQLADQTGPEASGAVNRLLDHWQSQPGARLVFGNSSTGRCTPILASGGREYWMLNIYPTSVEIAFQPLTRRQPFNDPALRDELRRMLNEAPGIDIPASKLELYPNFPTTALGDPASWDIVIAALDWFADTVRRGADGDSESLWARLFQPDGRNGLGEPE